MSAEALRSQLEATDLRGLGRRDRRDGGSADVGAVDRPNRSESVLGLEGVDVLACRTMERLPES